MAIYIKGKKRKLRKTVLFYVLLCFLILCYYLSTIIVSSKIINLQIEIQKEEKRISILKEENRKLEYDIAKLSNKETVSAIAEAAGLSKNEDNVIIFEPNNE